MTDNIDNDTTLYRTSDLYFSAYLCAIDINMVSTDMETAETGSKKVVFIFRIPKKDFDRLKSSYFGGSGTVKVQKYVQSLRSLKSMCHV